MLFDKSRRLRDQPEREKGRGGEKLERGTRRGRDQKQGVPKDRGGTCVGCVGKSLNGICDAGDFSSATRK